MKSEGFEWFITAVIILNTIIMCMEFYGASDEYNNVLNKFNLVFVAIFTFEAALKLLGLGIRYYFYIDWNKFDFAIVIVSLVSETPFLGDKYNYIMPGIMLGFSFIFLLMSYFKYETKMVEILRRYNSRQDSI